MDPLLNVKKIMLKPTQYIVYPENDSCILHFVVSFAQWFW